MRIVLLTLTTCLLAVSVQPKYSGGMGEPNDPYQIATAEDLMLLGETPEDYDKHFVLTVDIDLDPNLPGRKVFDEAVIAPKQETPFTGVFDGSGHTISHLRILGTHYLGLFGHLGWAEVRALGVVDVNIIGSGYSVGGLVGENSGIVTYCYSTGKVTGSDVLGGLVGHSTPQGTVIACYSAAAVNGGESVGGLVGSTGWRDVQDWGPGYNSLTQCYSTGPVNGTGSFVGGLVGVEYHGHETACFWDIETSGQNESAGGMGKTTAEMQTVSTFLDAGWDFVDETSNGTEDIWWILEGQDYPRLWWELIPEN
jgi:hypothetical protein